MRNRSSASRSSKIGSVAFVLLVAGLSAACSNSSRLGQPMVTGSTDNQRNIIGGQQQAMPPALPAPASTVGTAPLPAPSQFGGGSQVQVASSSDAFAWSAVGGQVVTVGAGESLNALATKYGVPEQQILAANQLGSASQISAGRVIVIPRRVPITPQAVARQQAAAPAVTPVAYTPAPAAAAPTRPAVQAPTVASAGGGQSHVVAPGDTLYSIARRYGRNVNDLAAINGLASPSHIRVGQRLALSGGAQAPAASTRPSTTQVASRTTPPVGPSLSTVDMPKAEGVAGAPPVPAQPTPPVTQEPPPVVASLDTAADPASADGTTFRWPVRGRIISGFGEKAGGERNDGINLAVPEGTSVKASEAGTVIYAGNELEGYGNLILIRHADGWVSAYAHNKEIRVQRGDRVRRGQTISLAGRTGSVSSPQVHFELRRGAKPVNPLDYLSGA